MSIFSLLMGISGMIAFVFLSRHWQLSFYLCLIYITISGFMTHCVLPDKVGLIFKDIVFLLPAYVGFLSVLRLKIRFSGVPRVLYVLLSGFAAVVLVQMFNPNSPFGDLLGPLVGVKVSLFYIPCLHLAYVITSDVKGFLRLLRVFTLSVWIPCIAGITQWFCARTYGQETTMKWFYPTTYKEVSQGLNFFLVGDEKFFRIPSTLGYPAQYFAFLFPAIILTYLHLSLEPNLKWRRFAQFSFVLTLLAALLCGSRVALFAVPIIFISLNILHRGLTSIIGVSVVATTVLFLFSLISGISYTGATSSFSGEFDRSSKFIIPNNFKLAFQEAPLGMGTGSATFGARHLSSSIESGPRLIENQYAKAQYELGGFGFLSLTAILAFPLILSIRCHTCLRSYEARAISSSCITFFAFILIYSLRGFALDIEPSHLTFWMFVGIICRLNSLIEHELSRSRNSSAYTNPANAALPVPVGNLANSSLPYKK